MIRQACRLPGMSARKKACVDAPSIRPATCHPFSRGLAENCGHAGAGQTMDVGERAPCRETDPIALGEKAERPLFLLEERVKQRLGLTVAPVIVSQQGQKLVLDEVARPPAEARR